MIENNISSVYGIGIYPIISMLIFISFFVVLAIWVLKTDKKYLLTMRNLPLDTNSENSNKEGLREKN